MVKQAALQYSRCAKCENQGRNLLCRGACKRLGAHAKALSDLPFATAQFCRAQLAINYNTYGPRYCFTLLLHANFGLYSRSISRFRFGSAALYAVAASCLAQRRGRSIQGQLTFWSQVQLWSQVQSGRNALPKPMPMPSSSSRIMYSEDNYPPRAIIPQQRHPNLL